MARSAEEDENERGGKMSNNLRAAVYARISTTNHGQGVDLQLNELRQYCERRGWQLTAEYVDRGVSGAKDSRPQLNALMADAARRKFDVVIVWKFDRFARSVSHLLRALETFASLGIEFVSLTEAIDTSTPMGRMIFTVLGAVAELERSLIIERVRAGIKNARSKGKRLGRPRRAVDHARIANLREQGASWRTVAAETGLSLGTLHRLCSKNPASTLAVSL
jgi:DNA invertase Pin-like site-specific DNA recombinase